MGNKDNPRRQKNKFMIGSIGALLLAGGGFGGYEIYAQSESLKKQDELIQEYKKQIVEQGSLIDQQKEDLSTQKTNIQKLNKSVKSLKKTVKDQKEKEKKTKKSYEDKIDKLEEELSFKKANEAKKKNAEADTAKSNKQTSGFKEKENKETAVSRDNSPKGRTITVEATGYIAMCSEGCTGTTATGYDLKSNPNAKVVAVDPNVIPLGTKVYVPGYGYAVAADTGGAINGNKMDLHFATEEQANNWGEELCQSRY
ncbi:3D domain-containing protein [Bacillus stercoris]|nr:3D domain-containing protein [Bacillus stercoris]